MLGEGGVELLSGALERQPPRRLRAADPVRDLDELGELGEPRGDRHVGALKLAGPPLSVPLLVRRAQGVVDGLRESQLPAEHLRHCGVVLDHLVNVAVAGDRELETEPEAVEGRVAGTKPAHRRHGRSNAVHVVLVLVGLERDVVAEPLRLLVGVRVTSDVHKQRRVVDDGALLPAEADPLAEP